MAVETGPELTWQQRLDALRATKLEHTREKQEVIGSMDHDDWAVILPPAEFRKTVQAMSGSGVMINDVIIEGFEPRPNHPSGGFFGPRGCGENFRALLESHPVYLDPLCSLAGALMVNFGSYRKVGWNPDCAPPPELRERMQFYQVGGIGAAQHFCQDLHIGLEQGWGGILQRIRHYREANAPHGADFYSGLEDLVLGFQSWISRHAQAARERAAAETRPELRRNLEEIAAMNEWLVTNPPRTFREACQWMLWHLMAARMYNGSGSLGRLDVLLRPYYERETAAGTLTDEEALFHVACLLLRDTAYLQLGGPDASGADVTSPLSFLILEAAHRLGVPANVGVCVGPSTDPRLFRRGVEILLEGRQGLPKFLGVDNTLAGFMRLGYPAELARERAYSGCHWSALPGREYCLNDCLKVNLGHVLHLALTEMRAENPAPSVADLWDRFRRHLQAAIETVITALDFHFEHMHENFPELVISLLCHGTIEQGRDASNWGVEFNNIGLDAAALATVADSFAALEERVEGQSRLTWEELYRHLDENWAGAEGERARLLMSTSPRFGSGGSRADDWAERLSATFTRLVVDLPKPAPFQLVPGIFSWAATISMGQHLPATPNGRRAGEPISHSANPDPGFRADGAATALAAAVAGVQCGYGNAVPLQIELDPGVTDRRDAVEMVASLLQTHFDLGGTQVNINVVDRERILEAHQDPQKYPDLVVRVTGFSAYFASLSPEFRQLVVDRLVTAD